ncbi:hypothetical protein U2261_10560 [Achromobacter xylosoxidans]|jgi:repressor LexA|uniref:LexA family protein n=1 Tax=Alcaligenes xylosoxydans xylosoxydans TaxID=85698 RepID=UPI001F13D79D|nr:hypothetical protein [Achromobacter xylosoxidans]MDZ5615050.1 hypothetical protein [Achromobacter xylosoxidans]MDZ5625746.1 hypothetical protein [Achromobacter xylosoxidans]MDZ5685313.1 hypothetical protein [Achromobacter xylosoxidans]
MKAALTKRQTEIMDFIMFYIESNGLPPSRVEISEAFGFRSPNAADDHLKTLSKKGYIKLIPRISRGIQVYPGYLG